MDVIHDPRGWSGMFVEGFEGVCPVRYHFESPTGTIYKRSDYAEKAGCPKGLVAKMKCEAARGRAAVAAFSASDRPRKLCRASARAGA